MAIVVVTDNNNGLYSNAVIYWSKCQMCATRRSDLVHLIEHELNTKRWHGHGQPTHQPTSPFDNKLIYNLKAATNTYCLTNTQTYCAKLLSNWNSDFDKLLWQSVHRAGLTNNTCSIQLSINPLILLNYCTLLCFVICSWCSWWIKMMFHWFLKLHHMNYAWNVHFFFFLNI